MVKIHTLPTLERLQNAILGALVGDAFGVPHEFRQAHQIPVSSTLQMVMPATYNKSHSIIPYGTWSDDGSQLLCFLEALKAGQGELDMRRLVQYLLAWFTNGHHQSGGKVFDCGAQTRLALESWRQGRSVMSSERSKGNGSLMRTLPAIMIPFLWHKPQTDAVLAAMMQSRATHPHPVPTACCAVYVQLALLLVATPEASVRELLKEAFHRVKGICREHAPLLVSILERVENHRELPAGTGHCVDTFYSSLWALEQGSTYSEVLQAACSLGNDTDTTSCVAGGLAGIRYGVPADMLEHLRWPAESRALMHCVFARTGAQEPVPVQ